MEKLYLFAPLWQDSGLTNELYEGSFAVKKYFRTLFDESIEEVKVSKDSPQIIENNILGYSEIKEQLEIIKDCLNENNPSKIVTLGGGCGVEIPIVSYLSEKNENLKLFWFDAHGDLNSPESSPSKYFHGMPLRFITESQNNEIGSMFNTINPENVFLVGARDLDDPEAEYIRKKNIEVVKNDSAIEEKINTLSEEAEYSYIHVDLDVIDPGEYKNVKCPVKNGLGISRLNNIINIIKRNSNVKGISILENIETDQSKIALLKEIIQTVHEI